MGRLEFPREKGKNCLLRRAFFACLGRGVYARRGEEEGAIQAGAGFSGSRDHLPVSETQWARNNTRTLQSAFRVPAIHAPRL
jgi:hypothetical protein